MPTYVNECQECGHVFEQKQSMKDDPLKTCPKCEKDALRRVIAPAGGFRIGGLGVHKPTTHWGDPR